MAHNTRIKPQAADTVGLTAMYSKIGTDVKNCAVAVAHFSMNSDMDEIQFIAAYMWNAAAADAWLLDNSSIVPIRADYITLTPINLDKAVVDQCLDYLLTLPQFNGSQGGATMVWAKS